MEGPAVEKLEILVGDAWIEAPRDLELGKGIIFRIWEGNKLKESADGYTEFMVFDVEDGKVKVAPFAKAVEVEPEPEPTCEGCRHLKYTGIPKWTCKKLKKATKPGVELNGYPRQACGGGGYRR